MYASRSGLRRRIYYNKPCARAELYWSCTAPEGKLPSLASGRSVTAIGGIQQQPLRGTHARLNLSAFREGCAISSLPCQDLFVIARGFERDHQWGASSHLTRDALSCGVCA
ncbi:unnamed protein product [Ectocarpus sp. 4 AP-2014]